VISNVLPLTGDCQLQLRSFVPHKHSTQFVPGDLSTVNDQKRQVTILIITPFKTASDGLMICDFPMCPRQQ
jgi:hypothetical protein